MILQQEKRSVMSPSTDPFVLPAVDFQHISNLTDDTGIIQHAMFDMPNRKEGYCIDDNARALLLMVWASKSKDSLVARKLLPVYLSFVHYMQTEDGYFGNFMSYSKVREEKGSEDSFGRTIMALGFLMNEGYSHLPVRTGTEIFNKAYHHVDELVTIRGIANSIVGICQYVKFRFPDDLKRNMVIKLADKMVMMYEANKTPEWHWYEPILAYDNAILPLALLNAWEITQEERFYDVAMESLRFLESKVFIQNMLRPIGNQGWCKRGEKASARFDQQGIDVMAMILCYQQAFRVTRDDQYLARMKSSFQWFHGTNDLGMSLYDEYTGGCADGLHKEGINFNQGAESTLAYWISHFVVSSALEE